MRVFYPVAAALLFGMVVSRWTDGAVIDPRYGVACELEDTGVVDIAFDLANRRAAPDNNRPWNLSLHCADVAFMHGSLSARSSVADARTSITATAPHLLAYSLPIRSTRLQLQAGYQPVRTRDLYDEKPILFIDMRNIDRFMVNVNGCTTLDPQRRLLYGAEIGRERQAGFTLLHTVDYVTEYELFEYHHYGDADNGTAATAGIGYWRDFRNDNRPRKVLCILEGFYHHDRRTLQVEQDLVEWISADQARTPAHQYSINASGSNTEQWGGRLQFSLSDRNAPSHPIFTNGKPDNRRLRFFAALDRFSHSIEFTGISGAFVDHRVSNVLPYGHDTFSGTYKRFEPSVYADHALSLYATLPQVASLRGYLFGRSLWDSQTVIWHEADHYRGNWNGALHLWLGVSALLHSRILMEISYSVLSAEAVARYHSSWPTGRWQFDGSREAFGNGRWAFGLRLLNRPATPHKLLTVKEQQPW